MNEANDAQSEMKEVKKLAYFLPNIFTALNIACGFVAIILATKGEFYNACMILMLGAIFDSVDGRIARLTGTQSTFGEQFDSLSDLISFGMAPGLLIYFRFLYDFGKLGIAISFFFALCGALRLARFNANIDKVSSDFFQGLPIPAGAMAVVGLILLSLELDFLILYPHIAAIYVAFYGLLMISSIPFYSFKKAKWVKENKKKFLFIVIVLLMLGLVYEQLVIAPIVGIYVVGSLIYFVMHKGEMKNVFEWKNEKEQHE
jgi:CDP-diacylglycerol--serine O-phosphatidyltransferase